MSEWKGKTALITGASYGIGEVFAQRLASEGADIIITARSQDRLDRLAAQLRERHRVKVTVITVDLAEPNAAQLIFNETERQGLQVDLLINNAGFGLVGDFHSQPLERLTEMIQVNITALVELTHQFLPLMFRRNSGAIINLSSVAAFQGVPYFAVYAATKSFILIFSEALWGECSGSNVRVLALCPGSTESNFQAVAGTSQRRLRGRVQTAEQVVAEALHALAQRRSHVVTGWNNKLMTLIERFVPRSVATSAAEKFFRQFSAKGN